jgi:hypothetical protein
VRIESNQLIALGYGKYVRSDDVVAVEPVTETRGPGRRALVWVRGFESPLVASRSETSIAEELTSPAEELFRSGQQRALLQRLVKTVDEIPGSFRRRLREAEGVDLDNLAQEANRLLA